MTESKSVAPPDRDGQASSPNAAPQVSLPKGGGAIRGLGEKFQTNSANGTASLTVPVPLSKSRSGFQPALSLSHSSGSGNGPFGLGCTLGLPSISRRTDKGVPHYAPFARRVEEIASADAVSDIFLLSGSEDLVPIFNDDGSGVARDTIGYFVRRYRPRIEGIFSRIESWTRLADGDTHWRTISRDNVLTVYGEDAQSRVADPEDGQRIFEWLVCRSYDDRGNAIEYEYAAECGEGVDISRPNERFRSRSANRYLKRVRYGNRKPVPAVQAGGAAGSRHLPRPHIDSENGWLFEVVLDYGDEPFNHEQDADGFERVSWIQDAPGPRHARRDPFSVSRSGFEVRTYRLCKCIFVVHRMHEMLGAARTLVRGVHLGYDERPTGTRLTSITQSGYRMLDDGSYRRRSLPALLLHYAESPLDDPAPKNWSVKQLPTESLENLPTGIGGPGYQWTDLDGEGIAGVLATEPGAWYYKPNRGQGRFGPVQVVRSTPLGAGGRSQLIDLDSDGRLEFATLEHSTGGFFDRTEDAGWMPFRAFRSFPLVDFSDPNVHLADLSGDGLADILITEDQAIIWHPSLGEDGFGDAIRVRVPWNEEGGPRVLLGQADQSVFLGDMSGDGLADLVRVRNGEVCYWPNLGYGKFGPKVTMDASPWFDEEGLFDARRLRFADTDGSGPTDLLYAGRQGVKVYLNESGNALSKSRTVCEMVLVEGISLSVVDLLGRGTACLVWSTALSGMAWRPVQYIDLMCGEKPHLLVRSENQLGAETRFEYASSTEFYLTDQDAGRPWLTRLPFPVHVIKRMESIDHLSRSRFVTRYAYHDGHYDGVEREFRGFGMVEQWDTEHFEALSEGSTLADNIAAASHVAPVHTKTWFHTGAWLGRERISRHMEDEYFHEPGPSKRASRALLLDDTILPRDLTPEEEREACRALKGSMLRQEVYADDAGHPGATPAQVRRARTPYTVTEQNFRIRMLQSRGVNRYGVFFTHANEALTYHYERNPADPRIQHALTLEVDDLGNVLKQAAIGYGRRVSPLSKAWDRNRQTMALLTYTENRVTHAISAPDAYRASLPCEAITYELTGYTANGPAGRYRPTDLVEPDPVAAGRLRHKFAAPEVAYEAIAGPGQRRRPIEWLRTLYRRDDLRGVLPLGELQSLALPGETFKLTFTPGLLARVFRRPRQGHPDEPLLPNPANVLQGQAGDRGGYLQSQTLKSDGRFPASDADDHWWLPSGQAFYSEHPADDAATELLRARQHFFLQRRYADPFGQFACVDFDDYDLLMTETRDALGNRVTVNANDYRVLQPRLVSDPNRNQAEVAFDTLGMVVGTAVMGKPLPASVEGDALAGFVIDLARAELDDLFNAPDPHTLAVTLLKDASTRIVYDLDRFRRTRQDNPCDFVKWQPACAATLARETHANAPLPTQGLKIQLNFSYSDGFGREIQKKIQAEPGPMPQRDANRSIRIGADGQAITTPGKDGPRWVGSGWTVFNNKGKPVRQFEPFFTDTHRFEFDVRMGVSPVLFYDPAQRVIATLHTDHTYAKVAFDPWQQTTFDVNDTCALRNLQTGDPRTDSDIGGFVADYFKTQPATWQTWHAQRIGGALGATERRAAQKAQAHADTPTTAHFDALGRPFLTITHNRVVCFGHDLDGSENRLVTRIEMDIEGNQRAARDAIDQAGDPLGRVVMRSAYDMLGNHIHQQSMEAGARWMLNDVAGKPIRAWDSRGHQFIKTYDALRRPLEQRVRGTSSESDPLTQGRDILIDRIEYAEPQPDSEALNLRTRILRHFDSAGLATNARLDADARPIEAYDFKGNLLCSTRQLLCDYTGIPDWSLNPTLNDELFVGSVRYDAQSRPIQSVAPRSSLRRGKFNVMQPVFNEANFLERMDVWLDREVDPGALINPADEAASVVGVANIDYDAKGRRKRIDYKNGASTIYRYDPLTLRLTQLLTKRRAANFPGDDPQPPADGWPGKQVQNLNYTYDPSGNVIHIQDDAQQAVYFKNKRVAPCNDYTYDALYRLIQATGREHLGQSGGSIHKAPNDSGCAGHRSADAVGHFAANDGNAMGTYIERYVLDAVGNFLQMQHRGSDAAHPGWTRAYDYFEPSLIEDGSCATLPKNSNRLTRTTLNPAGNTAQPQTYLQDAHGNELRMPHLGGAMPRPNMHWDYKDQLRQTDLGGGGKGFYVYDAAGQRVRKVWEKGPGLIEERIYIGGFEIYRKHAGPVGYDSVSLERETLHVMDDTGRLALVETCTLDTAGDDKSPSQLVRYQLGNHLGSASLELDDLAQIISYEEYSPYGSSTYRAVRRQTEAAKRYRFTGKERDEESGLYYHGARYYADWLGRWTATDPAGLVDGPNPYVYGRSNPLSFTDSTGTQCDPATQSCIDPTLASGDEATLTCGMNSGSNGPSAFASSGLSATGSLIGSLAPAAPTTVAAQATNSIDDLLTFIHAQSGFQAGAARPPTFSPRSASPFGTAAHGEATGVIQELQNMGFYEAGRISSEVRTVNGVVVQIGGTPGGPRGSFNMDIVVARPGTTTAIGDTLTGGVAEMIGDFKYGRGVINPNYGALGSPLETLTGRTSSGPMPAFPETAAPGMSSGTRWLAAGGGVFSLGGGALMLASIDTEHDPGIVTAGKVVSGGASVVGGGMMIGGALAGAGGVVAVGGAIAETGGLLAVPIMVYEMRPRGWIAIDPVMMERDTQRFRNGENVNAFCAQCHGRGGALDPNNDWNAGGARRAAFQNRVQWRYLGD